MGNELQQSELVIEAEPARPLATIDDRAAILVLGREVAPVAIAATAGAAAGVAAVAAARAARVPRRPPRRGFLRRRERVVAKRSFLVDVHILGR